MHRPTQAKPVFLTLNRPYRALCASGIAKILVKAISYAGLDGLGYSAKSFRPTGATGATVVIECGVILTLYVKLGAGSAKRCLKNTCTFKNP